MVGYSLGDRFELEGDVGLVVQMGGAMLTGREGVLLEVCSE